MDLLGIVYGIFLGVFSGLVPGVHANTISSLLLQTSFDPDFLAVVVVAMAGAHAVFEFVPAIFLLIPDSNTVVSILPGHRLLLEGKGIRALKICLFSALVALVASLLLFPVSLLAFPVLFQSIQPFLLPIMFLAVFFLLASERELGKIFLALGVFALSGALGFLVLNFPLVSREPLFALFAGLFAFSGILISNAARQETPMQTDESNPSIALVPIVLLGVVLGALADLLPGMSTPAQIAVFASFLVYLDSEKFLALSSSIGISHFLFAFVSFFTVGKARVGTLVAVENLLGEASALQMLELVCVLAISICISIVLTLLFVKTLVKLLERLPAQKLNALIFAYLFALLFLVSGVNGLLVAATATCIGVLPPLLGIRRTHVMGAIIVPTLAFLAGVGF